MFLRLFYGLVVVVALAAAVLAADVARFFTQPLGNSQPELIEVAPGTSFRELVHQLHREQIIRRPREERYLSLYARLTGQATNIKSGEYLVPANQTPRQLLALLVSGKIRQHSLTLVEGWRFEQIMQAVDNNPALKHTLRGKSNAQIMAALGHPGEKPEGRFMPDTYMFPRGLTDVAFLKRSYNAMQTFLHQAWAKRSDNLAIDTPYQALILASLIEKETAAPDERARIAGVFNRRLKIGMRLQTDPSVIYGIPDYDGNIHESDLERDTPYNTYTRAGLPPTPIASPSRASIRAALHPAKGDALYFVARGDGTHVFSDTLAGQNRAVRKYQMGGS
ncbi:endolytic transglycosylase MltG [Salinisphaera sp.]|uniref:endolytic transglycosylase MltG n=1 Tax=Salinisphaera sp. TaxID=1914330 RepID=UPI002D77A57F|nr:endolytic transglycosylase MltG [Salinisphaera sp.]HET7314064.1 endolytic transglycosylase MltG [Salinisphaera sp.]